MIFISVSGMLFIKLLFIVFFKFEVDKAYAS